MSHDASTLTSQTIALSLSRPELVEYLRSTGYWATEAAQKRYSFVLSPSVYVLSAHQRAYLERLAKSTYAAVEATNARLCDIALGRTPATNTDREFVSLAHSADRKLFTPRDGNYTIPPSIKVDLVQNQEGLFQVAEVDVYNPRGLGFLTLVDGYLPSGLRARRFPSVTHFMEQFSVTKHPLYLIISEYERFYKTPFQIFVDAVCARGGSAHLVEAHALARDTYIIPQGAHILAIPDTLDHHPQVRTKLLERYREGSITACYPPNAYLGSKGLLPFLRTCNGMEEFIPPTVLVGKRHQTIERQFSSENGLVLKATVSSGLKNVYFSDIDTEVFEMQRAAARSQKRPSWILQEQVKQTPVPVAVFTETGEVVTQEYFLRVTAYVCANGIVDVEVTGRPDRKVHGAPDCIQIPVIF